MEEIQNNLDIIRSALARSHHLHNPELQSEGVIVVGGEESSLDVPKTDSSEAANAINPNSEQQQNNSINNNSAATAALSETEALELVGLREQVALLPTQELERSRLEVELAAVRAALASTIAERAALAQQLQAQQTQNIKMCILLEEGRAGAATWRGRHQRLLREAEAHRRELDALNISYDKLEILLKGVRGQGRRAAEVTEALRALVGAREAECKALREELQEISKVNNKESENEILKAELEARREAEVQSHTYLRDAKAEVERRRRRWAAALTEQETMREALKVAKAAAEMWEARFITERAVPPILPVFIASSSSSSSQEIHQKKEQQSDTINEQSNNNNNNNSSEEKNSSYDYEEHLAVLETKVVDLALHLQQQRVLAESANDCYNTLSSVILQESHELLEIRQTLATHRPEWLNLTETNAALQAAWIARESHVEALQEMVISILDELTEQSFHCAELETQLAVKVVKSGNNNNNNNGSTIGLRRSNALQLLKQQQKMLR